MNINLKISKFIIKLSSGKIVKRITKILRKNSLLSQLLSMITEKIYSRLSLYKREAELEWWKYSLKDKTHFYHWENNEESLQRIFEQYCSLLEIDRNSFRGQSVIDIGCGPMGTLHYFNAKTKFGVDPLSNLYAKSFNLHKHDMIYINCKSEKMPFINNTIDNVISDNSLDQVDSFEKTIREIYRVLKKDGKIIFCINLREKPTLTEPHIITYNRIKKAFLEKFDYKIIKEYPPVYGIPCRRVLIKGKKR